MEFEVRTIDYHDMTGLFYKRRTLEIFAQHNQLARAQRLPSALFYSACAVLRRLAILKYATLFIVSFIHCT